MLTITPRFVLVALLGAVQPAAGQQIPLPAPVAPPAAETTNAAPAPGVIPAAQPAPAPAGTAAADSTADAEQTAKREAVKAELLELEGKAEQGDLQAALTLANQLVSYRNPSAALPYYRQAAKEDLIEAQEKLALLLLNASDQSLWPEGHNWLDRAARAGSVLAIEEQARILLQGSHGRQKSIEEARKLLEKARSMPGAKESHFLLGKMAAEGIGRDRDGAVAVEHLRRGVEAGSIDAMLGLVDLYRSDALVKQDLKEAERLAIMAYEAGSAEAAYRLAVIYEQANPDHPNLVAARDWLEKARERGHPGASARLGTYALKGMGEAQDARKGYDLYREAAARGHADAAFAVGNLYDEGEGVPVDPVAAAAWYRIAAESGHARGENEYGARLASGRGVPPDVKLAAQWFQRASEQNLPAAFVNLGELYLAGNGVEKNDGQAYSLFETAAKAGHVGGQERLSRMCAQGLGIGGVPDPVGAAFWAAAAASQDERLAEYAETQRKALNESQLAELEGRLAEAALQARERR